MASERLSFLSRTLKLVVLVALGNYQELLTSRELATDH